MLCQIVYSQVLLVIIFPSQYSILVSGLNFSQLVFVTSTYQEKTKPEMICIDSNTIFVQK